MRKSWGDYWDNREDTGFEILDAWAKVFRKKINMEIQLGRDYNMLDMGAGTGAVAVQLSKDVNKIFVYEPKKSMRKRLMENVGPLGNCTIIDSLEECNNYNINICIINSVFQYMSRHEVDDALKVIFGLKSIRLVVVSDILPKYYSKLADALGLIYSCFREGILKLYLRHVVNELRAHSGDHAGMNLTKFSKNELCEIATRYNFQCKKVKNLTPSFFRYTLVLVR